MHLISHLCILPAQILYMEKIPCIVILSKKGEVFEMEALLLVLFIVAEIVLLVITFTKQKEKAQWLKNRVIVRGCEVGIFLVALLLPQIAWDFRFKMCFAMLVIRIVFALVSYAWKRGKVTGNKSKAGAVVNAVLGIVVLTFQWFRHFSLQVMQDLKRQVLMQ